MQTYLYLLSKKYQLTFITTRAAAEGNKFFIWKFSVAVKGKKYVSKINCLLILLQITSVKVVLQTTKEIFFIIVAHFKVEGEKYVMKYIGYRQDWWDIGKVHIRTWKLWLSQGLKVVFMECNKSTKFWWWSPIRLLNSLPDT